ncbi:hypothetical protein HHK36_004404 [Tetracentron sinense]|uniref:PORR domain-containing protein n=1 Tax=Tetracentron sinense TaxID=13715 RepID=A0A834ZQU7_TETSI|nr:hypothetical protein HHK36_004404 [Tetracentron sinense]
MLLVFRSVVRQRSQHRQHCRTFVEAKIKWIRDRDLDHAVEKEKNLRPMLALKNLILSQPSKSLPISLAADNSQKLSLPTSALKFFRKYPSIFRQFLPGGTPNRPHVRLSPKIIHLDQEEQRVYKNSNHGGDAAERLSKLLMLTRINKLPLHIIDRLKYDLGLPHDYVRTIVGNYPDYFQITSSSDSLFLELVCWRNELAVSAIEKKEMGREIPIAFPLQFSPSFEMSKKVKNWVEGWQKLPYISPYEDASHLSPNSDQAEKWTVAVLHELLHLLVSKKTEMDSILCLGEYLGLRSRFKSALHHHPGIFYLSNKIRTHTIVLREAYNGHLLIEKHPLMGMRLPKKGDRKKRKAGWHDMRTYKVLLNPSLRMLAMMVLKVKISQVGNRTQICIWNMYRNSATLSGSQPAPYGILEIARASTSEILITTSSPDQGWFSISAHGAAQPYHGASGLGVLLREHSGHTYLAIAKPLQAASAWMAEALALKHGLLLAKDMSLGPAAHPYCDIEPVLEDFKQFLQEFPIGQEAAEMSQNSRLLAYPASEEPVTSGRDPAKPHASLW